MEEFLSRDEVSALNDEIQMRDGQPIYLFPDGAEVPRTWDRPPVEREARARLRSRLLEKGIVIDEATSTPRWDGRRPDYELCVYHLGGIDGLREREREHSSEARA